MYEYEIGEEKVKLYLKPYYFCVFLVGGGYYEDERDESVGQGSKTV